MSFRKTLGLVTAVTALAMWPRAAAAQDDYQPIDPELSEQEMRNGDPERGPDDTLQEKTRLEPFEGAAEAEEEPRATEMEDVDIDVDVQESETPAEAREAETRKSEAEAREEAAEAREDAAKAEKKATEAEEEAQRAEEEAARAEEEARSGTRVRVEEEQGWLRGERYDPINPELEPSNVAGDPDRAPDDTLDEVTEFDPFDWGEEDVREAVEEVGQEASEFGEEIGEEASEVGEEAGEAASEIGDEASEAASEIGEESSEAASEIGQDIDAAVDTEALDGDDDVIDDALLTPFGTTLRVGGGVRNFTQDDLQGATDVGGFWDVRAGVGTRSIVGVEAAYHGSAQDIEAIGLDDEAFLVSNGLEGNVRLNAPITVDAQDVPVLIEPFALAGLGWARYNLFNEGVNTSDINDQDDVLTVPLGVGVAVGVAGVVLDGRFTYRQAFGSDLVGDATAAFSPEQLNSWSLGAGLGFEF